MPAFGTTPFGPQGGAPMPSAPIPVQTPQMMPSVGPTAVGNPLQAQGSGASPVLNASTIAMLAQALKKYQGAPGAVPPADPTQLAGQPAGDPTTMGAPPAAMNA